VPRLNIGNAPRGTEYFGQEALLEELRDKLMSGHILLSGPRRFGKTGAMYALLDNPPPGYIPVYMNVEHIRCAPDFMLELISNLAAEKRLRRIFQAGRSIGGKIHDYIRDLPEEIDVLGFKLKFRERIDVKKDWLALGDEAMGLMAAGSPPVLLIIDEFPIMVDAIARNDRDEAHQFLHWFRRSRLAPKTTTRILVGGSVHLVPTLDAWGLVDTVNDLAEVPMRVFDASTAAAFVESVRQSYALPLSQNLVPVILELIGTSIPYVLAVYLDAVIQHHKRTRAEITRQLLEQVFHEDLIGSRTAHAFRHYRTRIGEHYPHPEDHAALVLLERMAKDDDGAPEDILFQLYLSSFKLPGNYQDKINFLNLMSKLDNDFYIQRTNGRCRFFSRVLRLWWLRNHCLGTGG